MEPSPYDTGERRSWRHRSRSSDSGEERRRTRHRRDREEEDVGKSRGGRDDAPKERRDRERERDRRSADVRDRYEEGERARKRRRSHSPRHKADRRRHHDRESEHRSRRERSIDHPRDRDTWHKSRKDRSPERKASRQSSVEIQVSRRSKGPLPSQTTAFENGDSTALVVSGDKALPEKEKPNFAATGLLAAASNSVAAVDGTSIVLKYHEPPEARKPAAKDIWKLFVFKGNDIVETIELGLRSCWLVGRELAVVDMPAEHPSISKQHAVIQFRYIEKRNEFGDKLGKVRPYLIDLDSANGTLLNNEQVEASRYFELRDKDMIQFGHSTREYVLMLSPKD